MPSLCPSTYAFTAAAFPPLRTPNASPITDFMAVLTAGPPSAETLSSMSLMPLSLRPRANTRCEPYSPTSLRQEVVQMYDFAFSAAVICATVVSNV